MNGLHPGHPANIHHREVSIGSSALDQLLHLAFDTQPRRAESELALTFVPVGARCENMPQTYLDVLVLVRFPVCKLFLKLSKLKFNAEKKTKF